MKHFSGSRTQQGAKTLRPSPSSESFRHPHRSLQPSHNARRPLAATVTTTSDGIVSDGLIDELASRRVVRPVTQEHPVQGTPPRRDVFPGNKQLTRLLSHSIDVNSDLSSSDSETDSKPERLSKPVAAAPLGAGAQTAAAGRPTETNGLKRRKPKAASNVSADAQQQQTQPRQQQQQKKRSASLQQLQANPKAAAASVSTPRSASATPPASQQQSISWRRHTGRALSAVACLVLLAACGSTLRAVASWQRGVGSDQSTLDAAAAAVSTGSSWLSTAPAAASDSSRWLHQGFRGPLSTAARRISAHIGGAAAAATAGRNTAAFATSAMRGGAMHGSGGGISSWLSSLSTGATPSTPGQRAPASQPQSSTSPPAAARSRTTAAHAASSGAAVTTGPPGSSGSSSSSSAGVAGSIKLYAVVEASAPSPFKAHSPKDTKGLDWSANWGEVLRHMTQRLSWTDERFDLQVITQDELKANAAARDSLTRALSASNPAASPSGSTTSPIFIGIGVTDPDVAAFLRQATSQLPTALFWNSAPSLSSSNRVDGYAPGAAGPLAKLLAQNVPFSREAKAAEVMKTLDVLWGRDTSDDLLYIWLVLLNQYVTPVPMVANTTKGTDLASLYCMIKNCGQKIVDCVTDKTCKSGLDCLQGCAFNDQVCQYRCIVSHETPQFEQFALCILQLHNCRGLNAEVPMRPDPAPMSQYRGQALTHEMAEDLFIGWMSEGPQVPSPDAKLKPYSWLVAAGKNPAYDAFGCQHQLYSRGKGKGQLWYEPVFRVTTLEGQEVWRRRRYRVRRGKTPGTFYYSVLDNGVTSNEYWRIVDCAEDLTYCLFYYSGAASAAGLSYTGAVLATRDGLWPGAYTERIHAALRQTGIEPWELSMPDNSRCADAPLKV